MTIIFLNIGLVKNVDFCKIWDIYDAGKETYIKKFETMDMAHVEFKFSFPDKRLPLFNYEAICKTIKGFYHELKQSCLSDDDYTKAGPMFLYGIRRGSGIFEFLIEIKYLVPFLYTLFYAYYSYLKVVKIKGEIDKDKLDNFYKKIIILNSIENNTVDREKIEDFIENLPNDLKNALIKVFDQNLKSFTINKTDELKLDTVISSKARKPNQSKSN